MANNKLDHLRMMREQTTGRVCFDATPEIIEAVPAVPLQPGSGPATSLGGKLIAAAKDGVAMVREAAASMPDTYKYRDADARREYMANYMKRYRKTGRINKPHRDKHELGE